MADWEGIGNNAGYIDAAWPMVAIPVAIAIGMARPIKHAHGTHALRLISWLTSKETSGYSIRHAADTRPFLEIFVHGLDQCNMASLFYQWACQPDNSAFQVATSFAGVANQSRQQETGAVAGKDSTENDANSDTIEPENTPDTGRQSDQHYYPCLRCVRHKRITHANPDSCLGATRFLRCFFTEGSETFMNMRLFTSLTLLPLLYYTNAPACKYYGRCRCYNTISFSIDNNQSKYACKKFDGAYMNNDGEHEWEEFTIGDFREECNLPAAFSDWETSHHYVDYCDQKITGM
ncbi:hypothetical protein EJ03DRAFT_333612 [Teratosphaeria nubilosa]|uniref:Uncharacterized protein n=1 Tax=Teratosphaeria nubilosa TaxID=161662 RepID=A0A6G1LKJ4_9PEZI|nr:hypothetical protein EJ03DRAFT_333612 [Teratosphaeria nubilosa]